MKLSFRELLILLPIFFFASSTFGQGEKKSIPLKRILDTIAVQHHVKFSYAENDVFGHSIYPPQAEIPLRAKLVYISNRAGLNYKELGEYIVIYKAKQREIKNFCAYVTDETGMPIENASVQVNDAKNIVTGADGYFELNTTLPEKIIIGHIGYEAVTVPIADFTGDCLNIVLRFDVMQLDEVITERFLTTGISKKKDGSFTIEPKKFGILPGVTEPDVLLAMQQLPGIMSVDETVSNINVRGGTHDQNLFMWNGIRLFQTGHFFGLISAINPNIAYDIKIVRNGSSAFYGESVSSAVDISSHSADVEDGQTTIGSNMINADFYTKIKLNEKSGIELSARRSFTDLLDFPTYDKYSQRIFQNTVVTQLQNSTDINYRGDKEFYFYDFTAQYHRKIADKHELFIHLIGINNKLDFTQGTVTETNTITSISNLDQQTFGASADFNSQWSETHSTKFGIYSSYYNVDGTSQSFETGTVTTQENKIKDSGFRFSDSNQLTSLFTLHTGYQFNQTEIDNIDISDSPAIDRSVNQVLRTHAFIGELEHNPETEKIYARAGLRINYLEQLKTIYIEPRLQFNYIIDHAWQAELLAERKSQTTSQVVELQNDFLGIEKRRWVLANDIDVPVQRSSQVSVGISYRDKGWLVSIDNFYKKVNGITTYSQSFQNQLEQIEAKGSYRVFGSEFLIQRQFKNFYTWLSYSWNDNRYRFDGVQPEKFSNNYEISHAVNTAAIYEWNNFKIAIGSRWFTGRPTTDPLLNVPVYDNEGNPSIFYEYPNTDNLSDFFQVNFSASYLWHITPKVRAQFGLSVLNIFNRSNILNRYYRINAAEDIERVNTYALERTPNALIRISF
ncbi:TonB-dependent receptor plug domain-containing protein [Flavobacterium sp. D11R37]|uniref:TonB-dependent receptor n=1 Tax=Flavobacterium coralii TaxID=2838017 RepID=UPI001CA6821A|nr:TonB-dependent receptor plug domain-containing protein [Flavobacterium coralii]MBY8963628.1 TonB-dependent receptor plug domain-containing protein [Flavobacterium coralii]